MSAACTDPACRGCDGEPDCHPDFVAPECPRCMVHPPLRPRTLAEIERRAILDAMRRNGENISAVCRELKIGRTTLYRKLHKYGDARGYDHNDRGLLVNVFAKDDTP